MNRLRVKNLNVFYGKTQRLFDVQLPDLEDGDILGLLGPNAAGKSTLMRALSGVQKHQGQIIYKDNHQGDIPLSDWHREVAYMPQTPPQESSLLPFELLWSAARALNLTTSDQKLAKKIELLFKRLGLAESAMSPMYSLSGGKRQLVGLALALIRNPYMLLLDEPTSALDLHWRMIVLDLVHERVNRQDGIAIAALHDLELAARYCNKLVLLAHGKVVASGPVSDVLTADNIAAVFKVKAKVEPGELGYPIIQVLEPML
ncbi:ABC transporter ATP-binding protein [Hahella ganghwensis]|uniref:ABC transporter ATP-binding protein n=1 Tax=Hahella ganghwensis TaxID=286420 RepID=UPI000372AC3A|nr:ABC transporter ATP-binding protein [Hahella ganghwensis]